MTIENFQCARLSSIPSAYYRVRHGWVRRKIFKIKVLRWLQNAILVLVFADTVFHKTAI